ncbi:hypothetical protein FRC08_007323 [Ceratobasidium sp. 394]|nr:hypothetical protein FRC08_007323 [Ceratobasidium sp. 394]
MDGEAIAWRKLLPAFIERCRTWSHKSNCEYTSQGKVPVDLRLGGSIICSCGEGTGFDAAEWKVPLWKDLLLFATRAAISPLFSVPYIESVARMVEDLQNGVFGMPDAGAANRLQLVDRCWGCGGAGKPDLLRCSKCKRASHTQQPKEYDLKSSLQSIDIHPVVMAHPLFWPSKTFFYPIGNTAAISLTQDLSPEQPADILLLGCGDPRNILFTLYADVVASKTPRKLDITCCDIEPAILARNILLFTLLENNENIDRVWDIFYHFKINDEASKLLTRQSEELYNNSSDIETWRGFTYGSFLKFVDARTLAEIRRHWRSYADFPNLPPARLSKLRQEQTRLSKSVLAENSANISPSRSAGMLWMEAAKHTISLFKCYWETGTTYTLDTEVKKAKNLNPTFVYSIPGEVFDPHYGTFPQGFHLTSAFAPIISGASYPNGEAAVVGVMKQQFKAWADAFRASRAAGAITIRFFAGEAVAFCRALDVFGATGRTATGVYVSTWRAYQINFGGTSQPAAPTSFDVIDTSNLTDHLGLLNLLLVTRPILKNNPASQAVLYTETLLPAGEDATKSFLDRICATVPTISSLLGIAPRAYVSAFTTHSNTHELLHPEHVNQYHERVAWVDPSGGDRDASRANLAVYFDAEDLAHVIFGFYDKMFASEQVMAAMFAKPSLAKLKSMTEVHYHRETVAALLQLVKRRIHLKSGGWDLVANQFLEIIQGDRSRLVGMNNYQDLCLQLHLYGVYTAGPLEPNWRTMFGAKPTPKIFRTWPSVPPMLCVVLTVPRKKLQVLFEDKAKTGTPTLLCNLTAQGIHSNAYSAINTVWGKCVTAPGSNRVVLEEDPDGINGTSDLVVSLWVASMILEFEDTFVALAIKSTPQSTMLFVAKLGMELAIFSARLDDKKHVHLLPYRPSLVSEEPMTADTAVTRFPDPTSAQGSIPVTGGVRPGSGPRSVVSFTVHIDIDAPVEREALLGGAEVTAAQTSPCTMQLSFSGHHHTVPYPYPVIGSRHKLRIARKSHYVEIVVPASEPLDLGGYHLDHAPILRANAYTPWNVHHIRADLMPMLDLKVPKKIDWLDSHAALQLSDRERDIRNGDDVIKASAANVLVNVKDSIHALMMHCSGVQGKKTRAIGLCEPDQGGIYAILLVGGLRLDLASFTAIIDGALIPLSNDRMPALMSSIQKLQNASPVVQIVTRGHEAVAWKKLLPAYVERCRTWTHKANCEYAAQDKIPVSVKLDENPICTCGEGIGFDDPEWNVPSWKGLMPFATRVAVSPLFSVSYIETVAGMAKTLLSGASGASSRGAATGKKPSDACWLCGGPGKPNLSACSKCKKARYCSATCQRQDWPVHKKDCNKP